METQDASGADTLLIDLRVFPLAVVHKATLAFSSFAVCELQLVGQDELTVRLIPQHSAVSDASAGFRQLLSDLVVQAHVNDETRTVRDALVKAAMAEMMGAER